MTFFRVDTWDIDLGRFTPQDGVRGRHLTPSLLRHSLRRLRGMGYDVSRAAGVSILVQEDDYPLALVEAAP